MRDFANTDIDYVHHRVTWWPARHTLPACVGACDQGHQPCQHRDRCTLSPDDTELTPMESMGVWGWIVAALAVLGFVAHAVWGAA